MLSGAELERRAAEAHELLGERCVVCPRGCKVDRRADVAGLCAIGRHAVVASYFPHFGEEDCLRGRRGSGTIFFSGCNLRCVFCQNHDISWAVRGELVTPERLLVGSGAYGRLRPDPAALETLRARGIDVEVLPTAEAVERYAELDPRTTAAALHLTC